jgi:hypothetical protein
MSKIPVMVVDDFFEDPDSIRNYALSLDYAKPDDNYPGVRTELLDTLNDTLFKSLSLRLFSLLYDFKVHRAGGHVQACFQLITEEYEEGWVHSDLSTDDWCIAGVVYLTPNAPLSGGTSLYKLTTATHPEQSKHKNVFYSNAAIDIDTYRKARDTFNDHYEKTMQISNVYNRLVMYNTNQLHRGDIFFGNNKENGRLTLVFFAKILGEELPPISRMNTHKIEGISWDN